jgi:pyruvate formate lyase activating enzyme
MSMEKLMEIIRKDREHYQISGGGVTFSGGEPLIWSSGLLPVLQQCRKEHISTAIETAGYVAFDDIEPLIPFVDTWLVDIKMMDPAGHEAWCGGDNAVILNNIEGLAASGADIHIKVPIIPAINGSDENLRQTLAFIRKTGKINDIELLPYHTLGKAKYAALGREYTLSGTPVPSKEMMSHLHSIVEEEYPGASPEKVMQEALNDI